VIEGPPVSQQTRRRARLRRWVEAIRFQIRSSWPADDGPVESAILVSLSYLFIEVALDLDNIAKPFLDALKGTAYRDDGQVTDLIMRKRSLTATLEVENRHSCWP
jgi:crossover junction endodeoxyribonuclease RusA